MRFSLSQILPGACPPGLDQASKVYQLDRDYALDQAVAFGLDMDSVFWFLSHLAERDAAVQARLTVWSDRMGIKHQDALATAWGNAKMHWQVRRGRQLRDQGVDKDAARDQATREIYDALIEVFRA